MQLQATRPFLGSVEGLIDNQQVFEASEQRAKELIDNNLAAPFNPVQEQKIIKPVREKKNK